MKRALWFLWPMALGMLAVLMVWHYAQVIDEVYQCRADKALKARRG